MGRTIASTRCKSAKIFYRVFPTAKMRWEHVKIMEDRRTLYVRYLQDFGVGKEDCEPSYWRFETDGIFYNNTQDEIYDAVMTGVLERVIEGCNAVVLAYGQTGTGKSLTINGAQNCFKDRGIAPRVITDLFERKEAMKHHCKMCIQMSYIETKKMYVSDLLNHEGHVLDPQNLKNVNIIKVKNEYTAMKMLFKAEGRRQFTENCSIGHAANGVLTFHVIMKPLNQTESVKKIGKLHIVDLAGVDTYGNITSLHKELLEVGNANLAKSQLEQFILILSQNAPEHILVKQRLNVLIQYLGDALSSHSILRFIGHLRTERENLLVTISMLRFGQIVRGLKPHKLHLNVTENEEVKYHLLEKELMKMKTERDIDVMLMGADLSANLTQERIKHMQHVAEEYLHDKTNEVVVLNVTDANTVLKVFKDLYNKLEAEKTEYARMAYEKAYQDAFTSSQKIPVKTESLPSAKSSRRTSRKSIKSKESNKDDASGSIKTSKKPPSKSHPSKKQSSSKTQPSPKTSEAGRSVSKMRSVDLQTGKNLKRMTTSNLTMKKSSASRRRSNSSTGTLHTIANESIVEEIPLPQGVPGHEEALAMFAADNASNYKNLNDTINMREYDAREVHNSYLTEVKSLQKYIDVVDIRKNELLKAQMQRLLRKQEVDEEGITITSSLEQLCSENLQKAQAELVEQQEKVLKLQTELRIALENYQDAKKQLKDEYEAYCQEKYLTYIPDLKGLCPISESHEITVINPETDQQSIAVPQKNHDVVVYESLQHLMKKQIKKRILLREKTKKWIQSCRS